MGKLVMTYEDDLRTLLSSDPRRMEVLAHVRDLDLADGWIGAGFVRNAVWDHLHGRAPGPLSGDVDVIWFDPGRADEACDRALEGRLQKAVPEITWSVKNQARMHLRNQDAPYTSSLGAMRFWPETATAVAARLSPQGALEFAAPFGLEDLFGLVVRPTPAFAGLRRPILWARCKEKMWPVRWPRLRILA